MSILGEYYREREGYEYFEIQQGFINYKIFDKSCYIKDIFILSEFRHQDFAQVLADMVTNKAKESGCHTLFGTIDVNANDPTGSIKALLYYKFKISHLDGDTIVLTKRI